MRIIEVRIFQFEELSLKAQVKALDSVRRITEYNWGDENRESLEEFCKHFQLTLTDYSLGLDSRVSFRSDADSCIDKMRGIRLWKWFTNNPHQLPDLSGNCPFTGYSFDENLLDPIREFIKCPADVTYVELMSQCMHSFCGAYDEDYQHAFSDEAIREDIEANNREFLESGELYT